MLPQRIFSVLLLAPTVSWIFLTNAATKDSELEHIEREVVFTREILGERMRELGQQLDQQPHVNICADAAATSPLFDAWGRMTRCALEQEQLRLVSAGPDREFNSVDDIEVVWLAHGHH